MAALAEEAPVEEALAEAEEAADLEAEAVAFIITIITVAFISDALTTVAVDC